MRNKKIIALAIAILFYAGTKAQTWAQKLEYLRKNISIYYIADPNVETPDIRAIQPAKIAATTDGIIFGATNNNGMNNCAQLLLALFSEKSGDPRLQQNVYTAMQVIKKPIVVNFINDSASGIDSKYLSKYNVYIVQSGGRNSVWPGAYSTSKTGIQPGIVLGEYLSTPFPTLKETFSGLVTKIAAGQFGAAIVFGYPSGINSYHIVSAVGNKFLTVKDANTDQGALLEIRDFVGPDLQRPAANQVWTVQEFGDKHHYFIKSRQGKVIDLKDGIETNGATVQMWGMGGYQNHRWQLIDAGGGYFYIQNWKSGKVLDVSGGVDENGRKVQSYQRNNSISQKWKFVKITGTDNGALLTGEPTFCEKPYSFLEWELDLNKAVIGYCPQLQDEWESVVAQQLGISAKNRTNHYIGWSAAEKPGLLLGDLAGRNWYPISDFKKVHVGKLCEVGFYDAVGETGVLEGSWFVDRDEKDFNLHVQPSSPFAYQIEKPIVRFDPNITFGGPLNVDCRDNWIKCGSSLAMEGEITPDDAFISNSTNPWLGNKNGDGNSTLFLNQNVGMYGPWIVEEVHCNHPEIHPVEMLWSETTDPNVKYLCLFQDDSDRFGYYANFPDYTDAETMYKRIPIESYKKSFEAAKRKVHPWAASPISGQFYVAFQIDPASATKINYTVSVETSREVSTSAIASQIPVIEYGGKTRVIKKNGVELFRVTELQPEQNDVGIRFELFKKKNSEIILGYMVISAAVSRDLDGKEGYMVIKLTKQ